MKPNPYHLLKTSTHKSQPPPSRRLQDPITTMKSQGGCGDSSVAMSLRGRSMRRNQVVSMEQGHEKELQELDRFQTHVAGRLLSLLPPTHHQDKEKAEQQQLLSLGSLEKLLDAFLSCEEEFKSLLLPLLSGNPTIISKPPLDRAVSDLLDRAVKSLDICNNVTLALDSLRHWNRQADIAAAALVSNYRQHPLPPVISGGQVKRAKKALTKFFAFMPTDRNDSVSHGSSGTVRAWSFGRASSSKSNPGEAHSRSLSWSVSRNWTTAKQVQAMSAGLSAPRSSDAAGLSLAVYTMNSVLVLAMWALVAAFPRLEHGGHAPSLAAPPRHLAWAGTMAALQELIAEEWKRKDKKGDQSTPATVGLLAELHALERSARGLMELLHEGGGGTEELAERAEELGEACARLKEGVEPFERKVREVFHCVVGIRAELQQCVDRSTRSALSIVL